ncbi:transcriptional regulator LysR [Acidiphilium multivorum AIU301]|nr:transcriptional regulator LysR [Acidiphilium multivorum AIU301]
MPRHDDPDVPKTISRLEQARTIRLLNRSTHAVSLTEDGERLLPLAGEVTRGIEKADAAISVASRDCVAGRVRITAPTSILTTCLVPLPQHARDQLQQTERNLRGSDRMADLADEAIDLTIRTGPLDGIPGNRAQVLCEFPWVTCVAPNDLARRGTSQAPNNLESYDLISLSVVRTFGVDFGID